jgi:dolichol-phosphate mannosyltransferase
MTNLSVVLSTYNEAANIRETINKLLLKKLVKEIIIIDDNSNDDTVSIINSIKNEKIFLHVRKNTKGFASSFIYGIMMSKGDYILRFDVDMHSEIELFLNSFEKNMENDCVIFSRYVDDGKDLRSAYRRVPSFILNRISQFMLSEKIKDYTSCVMFFKRDILQDCFPNNTYYANFIIEFVYSLILKNKKVIEIGYVQNKNTENNSKSAPSIISFMKNGLFYLATILKCFIKRLFN